VRSYRGEIDENFRITFARFCLFFEISIYERRTTREPIRRTRETQRWHRALVELRRDDYFADGKRRRFV